MFDLMLVSDIVRERTKDAVSLDGRQPQRRPAEATTGRREGKLLLFPLRTLRPADAPEEQRAEAASG